MKHIQLYGIDTPVRRIGLGCMGMSEFYGPSDDTTSLQVMERALELGVNFFDTADMYGRGRNEELVGRFVAANRDSVVIATKCGIVRGESSADQKRDTSPQYIRQACEASLKRLGIETIDLYYLHRIDDVTPVEESMHELARLKDEGKIRGAGLSEIDTATLHRAQAIMPLTAVQSEYSMMTCGEDVESVIDACEQSGIVFVSYSPLSRGLITGRFTDPAAFSANDFRSYLPRFQEQALSQNLELVKKLSDLAVSKDATSAQLALAWVLARSPAVTAIPGTRSLLRLEENAGAEELQFSKRERMQLSDAIPASVVSGDRYPAFLQPKTTL